MSDASGNSKRITLTTINLQNALGVTVQNPDRGYKTWLEPRASQNLPQILMFNPIKSLSLISNMTPSMPIGAHPFSIPGEPQGVPQRPLSVQFFGCCFFFFFELSHSQVLKKAVPHCLCPAPSLLYNFKQMLTVSLCNSVLPATIHSFA